MRASQWGLIGFLTRDLLLCNLLFSSRLDSVNAQRSGGHMRSQAVAVDPCDALCRHKTQWRDGMFRTLCALVFVASVFAFAGCGNDSKDVTHDKEAIADAISQLGDTITKDPVATTTTVDGSSDLC